MKNVPDFGTGSLLLSEPFSIDPYFKRSVILIVEHNQTGDIGFILNKCLTLRLSDLIEGMPDSEYTLCLGGPVQPSRMHYIHPFKGIPGAIHVKENIYWGGDFEIMKELLISGDIPSGKVKFFLGYSGWSAGQLFEEISVGDWGVVEASGVALFDNNKDMWYDIIRTDEKMKKWEFIPEKPKR